MVRAIVLNPTDNVATLIDSGGAADTAVELRGEKTGKVQLKQDIPFGHKVALAAIAKGTDVVKYGKVIGETTAEIAVGEHVHVHNVDSKRGRGDKVQKS
jgi:altronate dehydratase small subunit